jgi:hypothetical protein
MGIKSGLLLAATFLVLFLVFSVLFAMSRISDIWQSIPFDMQIFAEQAQQFWQTSELYRRVDNFYPAYLPGAAIYKFPPAYQLFIAPFVRDGITQSFYHAGYAVLLAGYAVFVVIGIVLGLRVVEQKSMSGISHSNALVAMLCIAFALLYEPFYNALWLLVAEVMIALCCVVALLGSRRVQWVSGATLALAVTTKLYPAFMLCYFIRKNTKIFWYSFIVSSLFIIVASVWVFGIGENVFYLISVLPVLLHEKPRLIAENLNLVFWLIPDGNYQEWAIRLFQLVRFILLACTCYWFFIYREKSRVHDVFLYMQLLIVMVISLPNYWEQYLVVLFLPLIIVLLVAWHLGYYGVFLVAVLAAASLTMGSELQQLLLYAIYRNDDWFALLDAVLKQGVWQVTPVAALVVSLQSAKPVAPYLLLVANALLLRRFNGSIDRSKRIATA